MKYLPINDLSHLRCSPIEFSAKVGEKNSPWLYVRYTDTNHGTFKGLNMVL